MRNTIFVILPILLFLCCGEFKVQWIYDYSPAGSGDYRIADIDGLEDFYIIGSYAPTGKSFIPVICAITRNGRMRWFKLYENRDFKSSEGLCVIAAKDYTLIDETAIYSLFKGIDQEDNQSLVIVRYDSLGNKKWEDVGELSPVGLEAAIFLNPAGNLYLLGLKKGRGKGDTLFLAQYLPIGKRLWLSKFPFKGLSVVNIKYGVLNDGSVVCGGVNGNKNFFLCYFDSLGQLVQMIEYKSELEESLLCDLKIDKSENIYLTGITKTENKDMDWLTVTYDAQKNLRWARQYNGKDSRNDIPLSTFIDESLNVYIIGSREDKNGLKEVVILKCNSNGEILWEKVFSGDGRASVEPYFLNSHFFNYKKINNPDYLFVICLKDREVVLLKFSLNGNLYQCGRYKLSIKEGGLEANHGALIAVKQKIKDGERTKLIKFGRFEILGINRWD